MANVNCCAAECGAEFCKADDNSNLSRFGIFALAILVAVAISVAAATNSTFIGTDFLNGTTYIDF